MKLSTILLIAGGVLAVGLVFFLSRRANAGMTGVPMAGAIGLPMPGSVSKPGSIVPSFGGPSTPLGQTINPSDPNARPSTEHWKRIGSQLASNIKTSAAALGISVEEYGRRYGTPQDGGQISSRLSLGKLQLTPPTFV